MNGMCVGREGIRAFGGCLIVGMGDTRSIVQRVITQSAHQQFDCYSIPILGRLYPEWVCRVALNDVGHYLFKATSVAATSNFRNRIALSRSSLLTM